jgi:hypothetical protein
MTIKKSVCLIFALFVGVTHAAAFVPNALVKNAVVTPSTGQQSQSFVK